MNRFANRHGLLASTGNVSQRLLTFSSSSKRPASLTSMCKDLVSRPPNLIYDYLSPTPLRLFEASVHGLIKLVVVNPSVVQLQPLNGPSPKSTEHVSHLPQWAHLIYFPPPMYPSELLPDACDDLHYPGEPFVRRMWAGGHVEFPKVNADLLAIAPRQNRQVACKEIIRDVKIKGRDGEEKIFVSIERPVLPIEDSHLSESEELRRVSPIFEHRDLVFMRAKTPEEVKADLARPSRILKPTMLPDVTFKITPDETLLFRFSALTFNAHRIHLDIDYARNVEGYKERLVHGPLSLTMMLKCLTSVLAPGQKISRFTYRNLAPILVNEEMKIQLRKSTTEEKWDVWIENSEGSYAVKGTAEIDANGYTSPAPTNHANSPVTSKSKL